MENFSTHASSIMTVISLATFIGILWWTFSSRRQADFSEAERIPFADEHLDMQDGTSAADASESRHV